MKSVYLIAFILQSHLLKHADISVLPATAMV